MDDNRNRSNVGIGRRRGRWGIFQRSVFRDPARISNVLAEHTGGSASGPADSSVARLRARRAVQARETGSRDASGGKSGASQ